MNAITTFLGNILVGRFTGKGIFRFLGGISDTVNEQFGTGTGTEHTKDKTVTNAQFWRDMAMTLARIADWLLPVLMIIVGMVGAIYALVLGFKYSKAENEDAKNEAKKKLINALIGVVIAILIMLVLMIVLNNASNIKDWIMGKDSTQQGTSQAAK